MDVDFGNPQPMAHRSSEYILDNDSVWCDRLGHADSVAKSNLGLSDFTWNQTIAREDQG